MNNCTRKGAGQQKNTNIDIIATRNIPPEEILINLLDHDELISDHRPIVIKIKEKYIQKPLRCE